MTKICTKCGKRLEDNDNYCSDCGTIFIDKNEIKKAEKKLKELTGGFLLSDIYQEILIKNNIPINEGRKIKNKVKTEIKSGKLNSLNVEDRIIDLLVEYTNKMEYNEKQKDIEKTNKKIKTINIEPKKQNSTLKNEKELKDVKETNQKLFEEKTKLNEQNKKLEDEKLELKNKSLELKKQKEILFKEKIKLKEQNIKLENENSELKKQKEILFKEKIKLKEQNIKLENENSELKKQKEILFKENTKLKDIQKSNEKLKTITQQLKEQNKKLENEKKSILKNYLNTKEKDSKYDITNNNILYKILNGKIISLEQIDTEIKRLEKEEKEKIDLKKYFDETFDIKWKNEILNKIEKREIITQKQIDTEIQKLEEKEKIKLERQKKLIKYVKQYIDIPNRRKDLINKIKNEEITKKEQIISEIKIIEKEKEEEKKRINEVYDRTAKYGGSDRIRESYRNYKDLY